MKRVVIEVMLAAFILTASGCGVWMNGTYSQILDRTVALSAETASRAEHGSLAPEDAKAALVLQAKTWKLFQDARDGKAPSAAPVPATP
jgi:hypothetical protein